MAIELFKILRQQQVFNRDSTGGDITFGHPIFTNLFDDHLRLFVNYHLEFVEITPGTGGFGGSSGQGFFLFNFVPLRHLLNKNTTSSVRLTLSWDTRNNRLFPTQGVLASASSEVSDEFTLSDNIFVRHRMNFRGYQPLLGPLVGRLNVEWGLITSRRGIGVPIFQRYFLGGITDVRGFNLQSIGPRMSHASSYNNPEFLSLAERGIAFGGNMQAYYNLEVEFPIIEAVGIKGVVFQDGGNAWNLEDTLCGPPPLSGDPATHPCDVDVTRLRTSWGFGVRWFSPLGPLRFEWGFPINRRSHEDVVEFQFTVGNAF
jgi:outer membrane protein insertion porin family